MSVERPEKPQLDACLVVWSCWLGLSVAAFIFVARYSANMPFRDEYGAMLAWLTHDEPVTFRYLWAQHNEHRIPLPKLVLLGLARVTHTDFRAGMFLTVALMSGLAVWLIVTARTVRGYTNYADAVIPLLLLHWGHYEEFLMGMLLAFSLSTFLVCAVLALVMNRGAWGVLPDGRLRLGPALLAGLGLLLLPLCGAQGTVLAPPLALWLGYAGLRAVRSQEYRDRRGMLVMVCALLVFLVVAAYFLDGYKSVAHHPLSSDPQRVLMAAGEFLWQGFGGAARVCWPQGAIGMGVVSLLILGALAWQWKHQPNERLAMAGFLSLLVGMLILALAMARGRSFIGVMYPRYSLLALPYILALYLAAVRWGVAAGARLVPGGLLLVAVAFAVANFSEGRTYGRDRRARQLVLQTAIRSGKSLDETISLCSPYFARPDLLRQGLERMRKAHVGPYASR